MVVMFREEWPSEVLTVRSTGTKLTSSSVDPASRSSWASSSTAGRPIPPRCSLLGDHEADEIRHQSLGFDEQDPDRVIIGVYRSQQRSGLIVSLGDRDGSRRDELVLIGTQAQVAERPHVLTRDRPQGDLHAPSLGPTCRLDELQHSVSGDAHLGWVAAHLAEQQSAL